MIDANGLSAPSTDDVDVAEALAAAALSLARRFAAGATMWCTAPQWRSHGRHVAVEFVHPVIVGKRALPALDLEGPDVAGALRLLSRPGDVLLVVSSAAEPLTRLPATSCAAPRLGASPGSGSGPAPARPPGRQSMWCGGARSMPPSPLNPATSFCSTTFCGS
jgi:hypothetical protein